MAHFKTSDNGQSYCEEFGEFDVATSGGDTGPTDYCSACYAPEPEWTILTDEEFLKRWPL